MFPEFEPFKPTPDGVLLYVRVTPGAAANRIGGLWLDAGKQPHLKIYVTAQAQEGKANAAVGALLAKTLGLAKSQLDLIKGATDRQKCFLIRGDSQALHSLMRLVFNGL